MARPVVAPPGDIRRPGSPGGLMSRSSARYRQLSTIRLAVIARTAAATVALGVPAGAAVNEPIGDPLPDVAQGPVQVGLRLVTADVTAPLAGIVAPGQSRKLYIVDQVGQLKELDIDAARPVSRLRT